MMESSLGMGGCGKEGEEEKGEDEATTQQLSISSDASTIAVPAAHDLQFFKLILFIYFISQL